MGQTSKYSIELVNKAGLLLADLSGRASSRSLRLSRNEAEEISWSIDLNDFEKYCRDIGQEPDNLLIGGSTEIRIKRLGTYLAGGQLVYDEGDVTADSQTLEIRATGFLNLFADRYTSILQTYTATQGPSIAANAITTSQALTNGSYGVTIGLLATPGLHDRTYRRTNIKDLIQNFGDLQTGAFDHQFTYNKVFNTYTRIGNNRPDVIFEYPGNIISFRIPRDSTRLANQIIALGSGNGEETQTQVTVNDTSSQLSYALRQRVITPNSVSTVATLTDHANAEKAAYAYPMQLPYIVVDGNKAPFITDYGIGDYVRVRIGQYRLYRNIDALFRVEAIDLDVDDNDSERIVLTLSA